LQDRLASRLTDTPKSVVRDRRDFGANTIVGVSAVDASKAREQLRIEDRVYVGRNLRAPEHKAASQLRKS
jgi:hypothetical protein